MSDEQAGCDNKDWLVPAAPGPLSAQVRLPGSKSMTNRALVLAALAEDPTVITGPLHARDTRLMVSALRALGCEITTGGQAGGNWLARPLTAGPAGGTAAEASGAAPANTAAEASGAAPAGTAAEASGAAPANTAAIDAGNAGTVLRFVPPVAALTRIAVTFTGDERITQRPVGSLLDALRQFGADIDDHGTGAAPFTVTGHGRLRGGAVTLDASASSQLISGLLLAAARFEDGALIRHQGPPVPSAPHIEMTVRMLRARGVHVTASSPEAWAVAPGPVAGGRIDIEPDLSNAVPFLAAALATGGSVTVADWPEDSLQPAAQVLGLLEAMGATVTRTRDGLTVTGSGEVRGLRASLSEVGELTPVLTALAAIARSPSEFTGIAHLRRHETDRLAALARELGGLGAAVTELPDGLAVRPARLRADGAVFDSHDDHRLVMAAAVLGLVAPGLRVHNAATVAKTFPGFARTWTQMLAPAG